MRSAVSIVAHKSFLAILVAVWPLAAGMATAHAQPKPKPACGIKALPLIEGNQWVYTPVAPPDDVRSTALKIAANKPKQPDKFTVKVVSVVPGDRGSAEITLEETAHYKVTGDTPQELDVVKTVKLQCAKDALDVSPESFLFAGEPGGSMALELGEVTRPEGERSYVFGLGQLRVPEWIENIKAPFTRTSSKSTQAELAGGSLDLQRIVKRGGPEPVTTAMGTFTAIPVQIELVGSVIIDLPPEPERFSIPANTISKLWVADNIGVIQMFNASGHMYQLIEANLAN
jgi:hypothetical protein